MGEGLAGQRHRKTAGIGEIRQGLTPRRMVLAEDQVTVRPFGGSPMGNPALKRPQETIREPTRMKPLKFLKQGRGLNTWNLMEERPQILLPDFFEGIATRSVVARRSPRLTGWDRHLIDPPSRALAEPSLRGGCRLGLAFLA
jgi:hypothetical protein